MSGRWHAAHGVRRCDDHPYEPCVEIVNVAGGCYPVRHFRRIQQPFHVGSDTLLWIDDRAVRQHRLIKSCPGGVATPEAFIGKESRAAACVMDDRYLEQWTVTEHHLGQVANERDILDDSLGDAAASVSHDRGIA